MKRILFVNKAFFNLSTTFIYRQIRAVEDDFVIMLLAQKFVNESLFPLKQTQRTHIRARYGVVDRILTRMRGLFTRRFQKFSVVGQRVAERKIAELKPDLIHAHFGTWGLSVLPIARSLGVPLVVTFHGIDASKLLRNPGYMSALPELFDYAQAIIIVSEHMVKSLQLDKWQAKTALIPYGIDPEFFCTKRLIFSQRSRRIMHAGRLTSKKGVPDLVRVFSEVRRRFPETELHILGDGEEMGLCVQLISELGLGGAVTLYGARNIGFVRELMEKCDIFVLNSRVAENGDMEGLPNTLLEAMSMSMAVVSTAHAGIPMAVEHEKNGFLVGERNNAQLKEALIKLLESPDKARALASAARQTVTEKFTLTLMVQRMKNVYNSILNG